MSPRLYWLLKIEAWSNTTKSRHALHGGFSVGCLTYLQ
jgi:hypothetical protein